MSRSLLDKRESRIRTMFGDIARRYDLLNHLLSLNVDRYWRWRTTRLAPPRFDDSAPSSTFAPAPATWPWPTTAPPASVCRSSAPISVCRCCCRPATRPRRRGAADRIRYVEADTQRLPFADDTFQLTTVAFGLRNVTDTDRGLAEMVRVTRPGGRVAILEFSRPRHWLFGRLYRAYFRWVLPCVGQMLSRSRDNAYNYLPASVLEFPDGEALAEKLRGHGLTDVYWHPLTFGIATLYVGTKLER